MFWRSSLSFDGGGMELMRAIGEKGDETARRVGRYAMFDAIASGGMATVHIGRLTGDAGFARTVAIKRLRTARAADPKLVRMFVDEARVAGRVQHPNVVSTVDVVVEDKEIFLILEYVHGDSLRGLLDAWGRGRPLDPRIACTIAAGALQGLHAAHEAKDELGEPLGVVHRDVSPQNILLSRDGIPRVVDFGIAKAAGRLQQTQTGQLKGKPRYMAPEQLVGDQAASVDRRTDVFGLAIVLWEMLTGERLFFGESDVDVYQQVVQMPIRAPFEVNEAVGLELSAVVMKGLERDKSRRFATTRAFAQAIEAVNPRGLLSQDALGDWVQSLVGERLAKREQRIREIESSTRAKFVESDVLLGSEPEDDEKSTERALPPPVDPPAAGESTVTAVRDKRPPPGVSGPLFEPDGAVTEVHRPSDPGIGPTSSGSSDLDRVLGEIEARPSDPGVPSSSSSAGVANAPMFDESDRTVPMSMSKLKQAARQLDDAPLFATDDKTVPLSMSKLAPLARAEPPQPMSESAGKPEAARDLAPAAVPRPRGSTTAYLILAVAFIGGILLGLTQC